LSIVTQYATWANDYQENQITILYDTMWNGSRRMADEIAKGIKEADAEVIVKVFSTSRTDKNDIITEVFKSKAILVGSPTVNKTVLSSIAAIMDEIKGLAFKNKKAAAFGTYGWSGESVKVIKGMLEEAGFGVVNDGLRELWYPGDSEIANCVKFGREFAQAIKG
jgi:flavorubredoxin